jgi:hypothetical protein
MNAAVQEARGEYVIFMNAGDAFQSTESLTLALDGAPADADVIYGDHVYRHVDGHEELHRAVHFMDTWRRLREGDVGWRWQTGVPGHQATLTRVELLRRHPYRTELRIAADHDALYRLARGGARFHHCGAVLATYVGGGLSWRNQERCFEEWKQIALDHTDRPPKVLRTFEAMSSDLRRQRIADLSTWELLRLAPRDALARSTLRKRLRRGVKDRLRHPFGALPRVRVEFASEDLAGLRYASGLSSCEAWGRWTEGPQVMLELSTPVESPARATLSLRGAYGPNVGKPLVVRIDGHEARYPLREGPQVLRLELPRDAAKPLVRIELEVPAPTSPAALAESDDRRLLGVALCELEVHAWR